jgi:protein-S-isoprenylcysteine O-methyltransferase Ste14
MSAVSRERTGEFLARLVVCVLFVLLSVHLLGEFVRTRHVTGLLLLVSEALVVVFTFVRRRAHVVDRSAATMTVTALTLVGPTLFRPGDVPAVLPDLATATMSAVGLSFVIVAKLTLGRSFGLVPANRGVVATGPYMLVRHPIYMGYIVSHVAFVLAHPTARNTAIVIVSEALLVVRALLEERVLKKDEQYRDYCSRVGWHLVPGVF